MSGFQVVKSRLICMFFRQVGVGTVLLFWFVHIKEFRE